MNNTTITLPNPDLLRQIPERFSWIDHRFVRDGHLARLHSSRAATLYLLLITVSDARGLSYYSDKRLIQLLPNTNLDQLFQSRRELVQAELIAYRKPHYQVLSLDPAHLKTARLRQQNPRPDSNPLPLKDALQQLLQKLHDA